MTNPNGLPYTPAVAAGDWVAVSGQLGMVDGALVPGFAAEVDQALENLRLRLGEHGLGMQHVVKTMCLLVDMDQFGEFNERYARAFDDPRPARSAFEVSRLPLDANVEIEAWAYRS